MGSVVRVVAVEIMRAGPVMGPQRRMDSNIAARRGDQGLGVGEKTFMFDEVAVRRVGVRVDWRVGVLRMSRRVEEKVDWRFVRPA